MTVPDGLDQNKDKDKPSDVPTPAPPKPEIREDGAKPPAGDPGPKEPPKSA